MIKYIIKEKNGNGIISDENNYPRYFEDGDSAADWAEKNDVDPEVFFITKKNVLSPEEQSNIQALRNAALKEQADYKRYYESMHATTIPDVFPGKVFTNDNQGFFGKAYDAGSYPLRLALGGYEGLAKTIYDDAESGTRGIARVAQGKDLNFLEKEATDPINAAAAIGSPAASKLVKYGGKVALKYLPALANLIDKGGKWTKTGLAALREGIAQGALVAPGQTLGENLKRWSKGEGEEMLGLAPMMGYGALGGALGELGSRGLKGLGKKAFSSEVKVRPSVQDKSANPPNVDFLFDLPKEYISGKPLLNYIPLVEPLRKFVNVGRKSGYEKNGKFVETTSQLVPLGGVEDLSKNISELGNTWIERRKAFADGTDASVNLQKIFEGAWEDITKNTNLGHKEKIKALDELQKSYEDALRTYHYANDPVKDVKAAGAGFAGFEDVGKLADNYPKDLSIPSDVMSLTDDIGKVPVIPFKDVLNLRSRVGKSAKFQNYNDPTRQNINEELYQTLYKNINDVITKPAQKYIIPGSQQAADIMNKDYVIGHNLSGKDLEEFLKTQDVLRNTTPWEIELPRTIARTTNKNLVGLPEMIGTGAGIGLGGATGSTLIDDDDTDAEKLGKMVLAGAAGGALGLGTVKSTMRGLGPARVMYGAGKSLSKEAAPSITLEQFEKDKKYTKTEEKRAAKKAQMLVKGGSAGIQVVPVDKQWSSVESMPHW